jgi:hypothetical protein
MIEELPLNISSSPLRGIRVILMISGFWMILLQKSSKILKAGGAGLIIFFVFLN